MSRTLTRRTLTRRTLTRWVLVGLVLCLVVLGGASLLGLRLHPVVVPAAIAAVLATWWRLADRARAERAGWSAPWARDREVRHTLTHDRRLSALTWAVHGLRDGRTWERTLSPLLIDLVDHRLLTHHGVDRATDPDRARELLGPELSRLVDDPQTPPRSQGALTSLIARIENL